MGIQTMKRIAMTGGIASGKSSVAKLILEMGVPLVDADALCRQVMSRGTAVTDAIAQRWPSVMKGQEIDRRALGKILFADPDARREEESIVLPAIQNAFDEWAQTRFREGHQLCVYDAALIFEHSLQFQFDGVLLVTAPRKIQVQRLMARDGLSQSDALARIDAQMPVDEKRQLATWTLENDGSLEALSLKFHQLWPLIAS